MKNVSYFLIFCCLLSSLLGCLGENKPTIKIEDYYQFALVNFEKHDLPASMYIPDETVGIGASFKTKIEHPEDFKWVISAGPNFELYIEDWGDNAKRLSQFKKSLKINEIFNITILSDDGESIQYRSELKKSINTPEYKHVSYHIYSLKNLGGYYYEIRNKEGGDSREVVALMAKSIHSFKLNKK